MEIYRIDSVTAVVWISTFLIVRKKRAHILSKTCARFVLNVRTFKVERVHNILAVSSELRILFQFSVLIKKKPPITISYQRYSFWVIRLGLEPKTPTLKVLCSTCWASESILFCYRYFPIASAKVWLIFETAKYLNSFLLCNFKTSCKSG